jgi:hypothetical protein
MTMYSKNGDYPVTRDKFPHLLKDSEGNDYTAEHAFHNRRKLGWWDVSDIPEYNSSTQRISWKPNTRAQTWWEIINKTSEELYQEWSSGRITRNQLLTESDWSQVYDLHTLPSTERIGINGPNKAINLAKSKKWEIYRQELRDLPSKYPNFNECIWPKSPVE